KVRYGILPQLFTNFVSTAIYRFEINIKDASTLGLVGAGGIGAPLIFAMNAFNWDEVGAILCGLIILVLAVEVLSTKVRNKLARG
ncbi:MAG TPA: phosphonate ABC transporter, permease protein PhnE, partial [Clostridium sp.]|nr:phosphonate ABC transporter, permease protein PhnE [Clostridium sp.]